MQPIGVSAGSLVVRPATSEDLVFVKKLARELFLGYGSYERYLESWFQDAGVATQIAEIDGVAAGFSMVAVYPEEDVTVAELLAIGVTRSHQAGGVGGALLDAVIAQGAEAAVEVRLSVADGNSRAQRLFASRGFRMRQGIGLYPSGQRARFMTLAMKRDPGP
ncbi:MAG TPA: GNAT family N-acetyltransferase [Vicinamibacteria bacterium]|nr:GNAT family N-acetyltransferase [Vicinamibacteria bacterium]